MSSVPVAPLRRLRRRGAVERLVTWVAVAGLRFLLRLPSAILRALLWLAKRGLGLVGVSETPEIDDLAGVLRNDPEATRVLRRMILESRAAELRGLVAGVLRHQIGGAPYAIVVPHRRRRPSTRIASGEVTIGVVGDDANAAALRRAYAGCAGCSVVELAPGEDLPSGLHALEITSGADAPTQAEAALARGCAVSLPSALIDSVATFVRLCELADSNAAPLRVLYPYLYYPPVQRLLALLAGGELGELSTVRVRATLGAGAGGGELGDDFLCHPAFDHAILAVLLGGPARSVTAYGHAMSARGGQALLAYRHRAPARYGLLELAHAPGLELTSEHLPHDLEVEVAGTHGIIWLRRGMAQRTLGPPIEVRVGRRAYSLGVESGLRAEWRHVFECAAIDLCDTLRYGEQPRITRDDLMAALALRDTARRALVTPGVVEVPAKA